MKKTTVRFLRAMGSIFDLSPASDYSKYRNLPSDAELIEGDWRTVGDYIRESMHTHVSQKASPTSKHKRTAAHPS